MVAEAGKYETWTLLFGILYLFGVIDKPHPWEKSENHGRWCGPYSRGHDGISAHERTLRPRIGPEGLMFR